MKNKEYIYVLAVSTWDGDFIIGAFSTEENAMEYANKNQNLCKKYSGRFEISKCKIDSDDFKVVAWDSTNGWGRDE